ncbi:RsmB/NOP family class I SAM-dependent RNA methyltransferase [bacterium]|nr:RsmB/NOP family class I SAM-dependent RNA methyltransferase [bacterium]
MLSSSYLVIWGWTRDKQGDMIPDTFHSFYHSQYGDRWESLLHAMMQPSIRCLRVNSFNEGAIESPSKVIPGLLPCILPEGEMEPSVQSNGMMDYYRMDPASILPAMSLEVNAGNQVLDMCSAPGGKALILAESISSDGNLTANEWSRARKERLRVVLKGYLPESIQARVRVTGHDASKWGLYEPEYYDRILLDAPCSSERHVLHQTKELQKWKPNRSKQLAHRQYALLCSALMACKPGGRVVYSTCSLSNLENDETIRRLIKKKGNTFQCKTDLRPPYGESTEFGWQILPDKQPGWGPMYWVVLERC